MKKLILLIAMLSAVSCGMEKKDIEYTLEYRVYYPGNVAERTYTFYGTRAATYTIDSYMGTNCLTVFDKGFGMGKSVMKTTAPLEVTNLKREY